MFSLVNFSNSVPRDFVPFDAEMRYTMTGRGCLSNTAPKLMSTSCASDVIESDDEVLANFVAAKFHSVSAITLPPTPPTSESLTTTPNGFEMDWDRDAIDDCSIKEEYHEVVLTKAHRRKYGKAFVPFVPDLAEHLNLFEHTSQGALDLIIPPKKHFKGLSNPFFSLTTKSLTETEAGSLPPNNGQLHNFPSQNSQVRIVRTIKRRLSARDILAGPNVKRRKLNKRSDNFEVIDESSYSNFRKSVKYFFFFLTDHQH